MKQPDKEAKRLREEDVLARLTPVDFTGRTAFAQMSTEEKLLWLAHAASFALQARRARELLTRGDSRDP